MQLPLLGPTLVKNQFKSEISDLKQILKPCGPPHGRVKLLGKILGCKIQIFEAYLLGDKSNNLVQILASLNLFLT